MAILFSAYRLDQYNDPEGFKVNIGMVLEQYPIDTIRFVTDPRTGVQRRHEWPPSVKNVVDACDQHMHEQAKAHRFANWGKSNDLMLEGPQEPKPTLEELQEKYGKDWGLTDPGRERIAVNSKPAPSWDSVVAQMQGDPATLERLTGALMTRTKK
jgi:hypothetical protein